MQRPEAVTLRREAGEAWLERRAGDAWSGDERRVLVPGLPVSCWRRFAWQAATGRRKRRRARLCGDTASQRTASPPDTSPGSSDAEGGAAGVAQATGDSAPAAAAPRRPGHGRQGAEAAGGAERVGCRHEAWAVGERCP